ncbi:MAG TPA: hypothetical protein VK327_13530 [Candidatus Paceibacterota bacterium]|nr:hypothetical protein [Candidatus Paceibacterota bacterium]
MAFFCATGFLKYFEAPANVNQSLEFIDVFHHQRFTEMQPEEKSLKKTSLAAPRFHPETGEARLRFLWPAKNVQLLPSCGKSQPSADRQI